MKTENEYLMTDLGNIAINPRGDYSGNAQYEYLDLVSMQGGSYLCVVGGQPVTGIAPVPGQTTEHWQCLALPGSITEEYTEIYEEVKRLAEQADMDAEDAHTSKETAEAAQRTATSAAGAAAEAAREAENSKDSTAGYTQRAEAAAEAAERAGTSVTEQIQGFDTHVSQKTTEATQTIGTARDGAITAVEEQQEKSVQAVKDQTAKYIEDQKEAAKQEITEKIAEFDTDVNAIKQQIAEEGTKQVQAVQDAQKKATDAVGTAKEGAVQSIQTEGATQTGKVTAEGGKQVQAVQAAAQEIIADREQIQTNKTDIADLWQSKAGAIVETAKGSMVQAADSAEAFMEGLKIFGKSEQFTTTGAQLFGGGAFKFTVKNSDSGYGEAPDIVTEAIKQLPNGEYYATYTPKGTGTLGNVAGKISFLDSADNAFVNKVNAFTITDEVRSKIVKVGLYGYLNQENNVSDFMINTGTTAKPYEPYTGGKPSPSPDYPQEIKNNAENGEINANVMTGNLFPIDKFKEYEVNNSAKQITLNGDRVLFTGKGTTAKEDMVFFLNKKADKLSLPPGKYTLSFKSNKPYGSTNGENTVEMFLVAEKKSGIVNRSTGSAGKQTVDIEDGDKLHFRFDINNNSMSAEFYDIMFNLGDTPLPYKPHAEQSLAIQTPDGLPGISVTSGGNYTDSTGRQWVCDEICEQGGVIGVKKYLTEKTIDKNSELNNRLSSYGAVEKNTIITRVADKTLKKNGAILAKEFKNGYVWHRDEECAGMTEQGIDFRISRERLGLAAETTIEENNAAVLKYLETHPLYFVAQLNVPVFEPLPEEVQQKFKALRTYYPTTVVTNSANADMQLDYVADTQLYIDKKIKEHVTANIQKTANLLSLMPLSTQAAIIENDTNNILDNMEEKNEQHSNCKTYDKLN